jgi:hypothetical protein
MSIGKMIMIAAKRFAAFSLLFCLMLGAASAAQAAGAIAIGQCDRFGWSARQPSVERAREVAMQYCSEKGDTSCHVIAAFAGACAALAVDGDCGARGWATAATRDAAEETARSYCTQYGGSNCTVRRTVCDEG